MLLCSERVVIPTAAALGKMKLPGPGPGGRSPGVLRTTKMSLEMLPVPEAEVEEDVTALYLTLTG